MSDERPPTFSEAAADHIKVLNYVSDMVTSDTSDEVAKTAAILQLIRSTRLILQHLKV